MAFGWFHDFLYEERVLDLAAAEATLQKMLDDNAMIVHAYRETDPDNPELIGRHGRLCAFTSGVVIENANQLPAHEISRFLLDTESLALWQSARERNQLIDSRWAVVDLYSHEVRIGSVYGKAMLCGKGRSLPAA
jgi:hypothetical protein